MEAYLQKGDHEAATRYYQKSLGSTRKMKTRARLFPR
jgi:hypothetical protein